MRFNFIFFILILLLPISQAGESCSEACGLFGNTYIVQEEDPFEWKGPYNHLSKYRMFITKNNTECWCEVNEGYKWTSIDPSYEPIMVWNMPPMSWGEGIKMAPKVNGWTIGGGKGIVEPRKEECGMGSENVLDVEGCPKERRLFRSCCCLAGKRSNGNYCYTAEDTELIKGRVFLEDDKYKYPFGGIPKIKVELHYNNKDYETYTDAGGFFAFEQTLKKDRIVEVTFVLESKNIQIHDDKTSQSVWVRKKIKVKNPSEGIDINFTFNNKTTATGYTSGSSLSNIPSFLRDFLITKDMWEFAISEFNANLKPVIVVPNVQDIIGICTKSSGCYDTVKSKIYLNKSYMKYRNDDTPYTLLHEFGHHLDFCAVPWRMVPGTRNHDGILNPSTDDSLMEGKATFYGLLALNSLRWHPGLMYKKSFIFDGKNFEINYKAWHSIENIQREEYAVVSLLWDIVDKAKDNLTDEFTFSGYVPENIQISNIELWKILKDPSTKNVYELYLKLIPLTDKIDLDNLFIAHGFFMDKEVGDGVRSPQEVVKNISWAGEFQSAWSRGDPYRDMNKNGRWDSWEYFVDLASTHQYPGVPTYTKGIDQVGTAADYNRTNRRTMIDIPKSYLKVPNGEYVVTFEFPNSELNFDYITNVNDGYLYIEYPPKEYNAKAIIKPSPEVYISDESIELTTEEYLEKLSQQNDYIIEKEFILDPIEKESLITIPSFNISENGINILFIILCVIFLKVFFFKKKKK